MHHFLGIETTQEDEGIFICQKQHIVNLLKKFNTSGCEIVATPLVAKEKMKKDDGSSKIEGSRYRNLIGSLLNKYKKSRTGIMYASSLLSRLMLNPSRIHYGACGKRSIKILTGNH